MWVLACSDLGGDCDFIATGDNGVQAKDVMVQHQLKMHPDVFRHLSSEEKSEMMQLMDQMVSEQ